MNAGDALWYLHAELTMLERRYSTDPSTLELLAKMRESTNTIGAFIKVPPPPPDKLQATIDYIASTMTSTSVPPAPQAPQQAGGSGGRNKFSDPERIEAAKTLLEQMVDSGRYDWAAMVTDLHSRVNGDSPFITDKQFRALVNIGRGGQNMEFWDQLADEYPEAVAYAEAAADRA